MGLGADQWEWGWCPAHAQDCSHALFPLWTERRDIRNLHLLPAKERKCFWRGGERCGGVSGVRESPGICWAQHGTAWHCDFLVGVAGKSRPSAGVIILVVCTAELLVEALGSVSHGTAQADPLHTSSPTPSSVCILGSPSSALAASQEP